VGELSIERRRLLGAGAALGVGGLIAAGRSANAAAVNGQGHASLSIFDFGAVGDGITDDSAAFSAALQASAAQGRMVIVPGYTYAIKQTITFNSTADVGKPWGFMCQGATLQSQITTHGDVISLISNNTVRYFQLTGALKITGSGSDGDGLHIYAPGSSIYFYNALIDGLSVEAVGGDGLVFEGNVFESSVMNSYFQDCGRNGATFAQSKGGICSAISLIGCFFSQNGNYGMAATNFDGTYGGTTDVRVYGGYCRDNQSYGFYYNNGTGGGTTIEQVGFENNCRSMTPGSPNGAHVYGLVGMQMRSCTGYDMNGGATYLLSGWFSALTLLEGCSQDSGGQMAATGKSRVVQVNGNSAGHVLMVGCSGGLDVAIGSTCTWQAQNCAGPSPFGALNIRGTMANYSLT
jgi:hypothetical protein